MPQQEPRFTLEARFGQHRGEKFRVAKARPFRRQHSLHVAVLGQERCREVHFEWDAESDREGLSVQDHGAVDTDSQEVGHGEVDETVSQGGDVSQLMLSEPWHGEHERWLKEHGAVGSVVGGGKKED